VVHVVRRNERLSLGSDFTGRPAASSNSETAGTPANSAVGKSKTAQRILAAQKQPPGPTLFLGNLGFQATEETIRNMFTAHMNSLRQQSRKAGLNDDNEGKEEMISTNDKKLRKVRVGTFEDSGLCKGSDSITFIFHQLTLLLDGHSSISLTLRTLQLPYSIREIIT
jgi:hypothetical protein